MITLEELKEKMGSLRMDPEKREFIASDGIRIPRGVISEITGTARTEWMTRFLSENPELSTFWAEEKLSVLPTALHQRGVDLSRVLMAETGERLFQTLRKALKSQLFDCVVLPGAIEEIKMLKALQLFSRESNACVFFLSKRPKTAWAIAFQLRVDWKPGQERAYQAQVLKSKFSDLSAL